MREAINLEVQARPRTGKGASHQLRRSGGIPGIVYGGKGGPETVTLNEHSFGKLYATGTLMQTVLTLDLGGRKTRVIPREVQVDPVTDRPIHVDFMRLEPGARIRIAIPVRFKGHENSPGIKVGGVLNIVTHEIDVYCSADNIPDYIEGSLEGLAIGDSLHIRDFVLPAGVKPVVARNFTVASIAPPTTYVEEAVATAATEAVAAEGAPAAEAAEAAAAPAAGAAAPAAGAAAPAVGATPAAAKGKTAAPPAEKKK